MGQWKNVERRVAALLGGVRVPVTGRARGSAPDVQHAVYAVEVKHRKRLPDWLHEAMAQARAAQRDGQIPLVVLHEQRQPFNACYCVLPLDVVVRLQAQVSCLT